MKFINFRNLMFFLLVMQITVVSGQNLTLKNEEVIFSFSTQNGKMVTLNKDKNDGYLIYRFGTRDKIEFEFPDKTKNSWTKFKYSFYMRGGGIQNEAMDLNYVYFTNQEFTYIIYDTYHAVGNKQQIGIKIINLNTNKETNIKGIKKTSKGTMVNFRDNNLLEIGGELFD